MPDELNSFLKDLGVPEESFLDKPLNVDDTPEKEEESKEEERFKNRYTRRREKEAQRLRDEVIQLNERVKVLSEVGKFKEEVGDDELKKVEAIFGTDTPEKLAATNILKEALSGLTEKAKRETLQEIQNREGEDTEAQKEADEEVDDFLDRVEEDYDIDMSDENVRKGYITLMEKMSPKYDDGNIKEFADPDAVAETFLALQKRQGSSKARELASRSMTHSGESQSSKLPQNAIDRFMQENGLGGSW
jgi:hypothetical protein